MPLRVPWVGVGGRIPPPPVSSSACLGGGKAAPLPVLGHAWGCPSITLTSCPRRPLRRCRRGVILLGKAMLLLQGPGAVRGWGVYGLFAGSLGSLVQRCYPTALGVLGTHLILEQGGGNPGLVVVRGACLQLQILPRRGGPRLLLCLDPSQRLRWSQAKSAAAARASAPWARLFPRVWTWICISKLEALGSGFSVNVWQLSALPWVRLIREPALSCCRN